MAFSSKPKIAIIIGSTRDSRWADKPANWVLEKAQQRDDMDFELVDLRDYDLPFFNEMASNAWMPSQDPKAVAWQNKVGEFDGYIFVTSEYNRSIPASLKNALDHAYVEWNKKPGAVVSYGSVGGTRAAEHLRTILIELQMAPVRAGVHIGGGELMKVHPMGANGPISEIEEAIAPSADAMFDGLRWWVDATRYGREQDEKQSEAA